MAYDSNNIFAKILRGEIPCDKVLESSHALAFRDIAPQAPIHVLVIPKGPYVSFDDFTTNATPDEVTDFFVLAQRVAVELDLPANGYRVLSNIGRDGGQEVMHFHLHIFGGCALGRMVTSGLV